LPATNLFGQHLRKLAANQCRLKRHSLNFIGLQQLMTAARDPLVAEPNKSGALLRSARAKRGALQPERTALPRHEHCVFAMQIGRLPIALP